MKTEETLKRIPFRSVAERNILIAAVVICLLFTVLDQITKQLVVEKMAMNDRIRIVPGFFDLTYVTNPGCAFSMLEGQGVLLMLISLAVFALICIFHRTICCGWRERYLALGLVASGILGNTFDRIVRSTGEKFCDGQVVDFISWYWKDPQMAWPTFNVADSCICIGVGIFIISSFIRPDDSPEKAGKKQKEQR